MYISEYNTSSAFSDVNGQYMWYTISEYFNDCLDDDFLNKTFLVNVTSEFFGKVDMYVKIKLIDVLELLS